MLGCAKRLPPPVCMLGCEEKAEHEGNDSVVMNINLFIGAQSLNFAGF